MFPINLEIQHSVYAFDTACFYCDEETALDRRLQSLRKQINDDKQLREKIASLEQDQLRAAAKERGEVYSPPSSTDGHTPRARLRAKQKPRKRELPEEFGTTLEDLRQHMLTAAQLRDINSQIRTTKEALKNMIASNLDMERHVRPEALNPHNVVSIFDSNLTRCLRMSNTDINDSLVIIKVYYFGVAENIIKHGFYMNGEHYVFFSASAGQIRTKKFVAIREADYKAIENTLTCGLSEDAINAKGGINVN